ncbi:MAG: hypothetical protein RLZZ210_1638 [Pseudomonadota bacterium]|jgi:hypothetical protein
MPKQNFDFELYVEGVNDKHAITQLMLKYNFNNIYYEKEKKPSNLIIKAIDETGQTGGIDGINNFLQELDTLIKASKKNSIGIIVDADLSSENRWNSIRDKLLKIGYSEIPKEIPQDGFISNPHSEYNTIIGIWIMPNNNSKGKIEDFLQYLIPNKEHNKLFAFAQKTINELMPQTELINENNRFKDIDESKALIHTWLAWQDPPAKPFGTAINATIFNSQAPEAINLINWLKKLFNQENI